MSDRGIVWKDRARKWREKDKCKRPSQSIFALPHLFLLLCLPGGSEPEGENGLPLVEKG